MNENVLVVVGDRELQDYIGYDAKQDARGVSVAVHEDDIIMIANDIVLDYELFGGDYIQGDDGFALFERDALFKRWCPDTVFSRDDIRLYSEIPDEMFTRYGLHLGANFVCNLSDSVSAEWYTGMRFVTNPDFDDLVKVIMTRAKAENAVLVDVMVHF